jgi:hypothetical protein
MALVDVVVVAYNSRDVLRTCVEPFLGDEEIHTIVVDNASPDDSGDAVANLAVTLVGERDNRGFGAGCNAGWRAGSAPYVLFLNPDAELTANAVKTLGRALAVDTTVGAVGPRILERGGALDHSIRRFPRLSSTYAQAFFLHRLSRTRSWGDEVVRDDAKYASSHDVEWLSGACLMVRRSALEQLQGFDEGFFTALVLIHLALPGTLGSIKEAFLPKGGLVAEQANVSVGSGRVASFGPAVAEISRQPLFGVGFGTRIVDIGDQNAYVLDDEWLSTALETGLLGFAAWVWLFVRYIRRLGRAARADTSQRGWLLTALTASVASFAVGMAFYDAFSFVQVTIAVFILLALGSAALHTAPAPKPS